MFFGTGTIERRDIRNRSHPANRGSAFISSNPTGRASVSEYVERFIVVDVKYSETLARPVGLDEIKADPRFAGWDLLRISRLSIVPVPKNIWTILIELSKSK